MDYRLKSWLLPALFISLLSGRAAKVPLQYEYPPLANSPATELKIAITYPVDQRSDKEAMDKVLSQNPVDELRKIIVEEIQSMGFSGR